MLLIRNNRYLVEINLISNKLLAHAPDTALHLSLDTFASAFLFVSTPTTEAVGIRILPMNTMYTLNPAMTAWAFEVSHNIELPDTEQMRLSRAGYTGFANALKPPFVTHGDTVSATVSYSAYMPSWKRPKK